MLEKNHNIQLISKKLYSLVHLIIFSFLTLYHHYKKIIN